MKTLIMLIDADNLSVSDIKKAYKYASSISKVIGGFIFKNNSSCDQKLKDYAEEVKFVIKPPNKIKKDGADHLLMMEAAKHFEKDISGFLLVASDSIYEDLIIECKAYNKEVLLACKSNNASKKFTKLFDEVFYLDETNVKIDFDTTRIKEIAKNILGEFGALDTNILKYLIAKSIGETIFATCVEDESKFFDSISSLVNNEIVLSNINKANEILKVDAKSVDEIVNWINDYIIKNDATDFNVVISKVKLQFSSDSLEKFIQTEFKTFLKKYFRFNNIKVSSLKKSETKVVEKQSITKPTKNLTQCNSIIQAIKSILLQNKGISVNELTEKFIQKYGEQKSISDYNFFINHFFECNNDVVVKVNDELKKLIKSYNDLNLNDVELKETLIAEFPKSLTKEFLDSFIIKKISKYDDFVNVSIITDVLSKVYNKSERREVYGTRFSTYIESDTRLITRKVGKKVEVKLKS